MADIWWINMYRVYWTMALYIMCDIDGHVLSNPNNFYVCVHTLLNSFKMEAVMLSYRNHFYMDWFLYDNGLHHERVKKIKKN